MPNEEDKEIVHEMVMESVEQLDGITDDIINLEGAADTESVNKIFRIFHSIKGNLGMLGFSKCAAFAHKAEDVVSLIRDGKLQVDKEIAGTLLKSLDSLHHLLEDIKEEGRDDRDVSDVYQKLQQIEATVAPEPVDDSDHLKRKAEIESEIEEFHERVSGTTGSYDNIAREPGGKELNILVAEDDFQSRLLMQEFLTPYGSVFAVVNGEEAVLAFLSGMEKGKPYDLVCLDINMPVKSGQTALKEMREIEKSRGTVHGKGAKIVMTTALTDPKSVMASFDEMCNAYIFKPVFLPKFLEELKKLELI